MKVYVCALAKNEHLYINEWVNHYVKLGVDKIFIFDNDDSKYYGNYVFVSFYPNKELYSVTLYNLLSFITIVPTG